MTAIPAIPVPVSIPELTGPPLWPASAVAAPGGDVAVAGVPLAELAGRYGTPVQVVDEGEVRARARAWRRALPDAEVVYAAEAFLCRAMVDWMAEEGLGLAVRSAAELELAASRGFPVDRIVLHGHAKSPRDLRTASRLGVGRIVIESAGEIARLASRVPGPDPQQVLIRVVPGGVSATGAVSGAGTVSEAGPGGRRGGRTVGGDRGFGLSIAASEAEEAVARILGQPGLELVGLHCRPGSRLTAPEPHAAAVRHLVAFLARIRDRFGIALPEVVLGGDPAVPGLPGAPAPAPAAYARRTRDALLRHCAEADFPLPRLTAQPGRSLVAPAGVALHRVLAVRRSPGARTLVAVDGGTGDGRTRYAVRLIGRPSAAPMRATTVVGPYDDPDGPGGLLADGVELPEDIRPGDLLAVPASGAYHLSGSSAREPAGRPPVIAVADGRSRLLVRRETPEFHRARDIGL
ncbi:diaminopimelate decarboxylase [Streptomyces sp. NPDC006798]|uniref:diaminopimelate decarboxylase family protein n=1 Tax=Streptomyces sp. NPDC006798 TaxID=3155462 RepID=UPI0033C0CAF2